MEGSLNRWPYWQPLERAVCLCVSVPCCGWFNHKETEQSPLRDWQGICGWLVSGREWWQGTGCWGHRIRNSSRGEICTHWLQWAGKLNCLHQCAKPNLTVSSTVCEEAMCSLEICISVWRHNVMAHGIFLHWWVAVQKSSALYSKQDQIKKPKIAWWGCPHVSKRP